LALLTSTETQTTSLTPSVHQINQDAGVQIPTLVTPKLTVVWVQCRYIWVVHAILQVHSL